MNGNKKVGLFARHFCCVFMFLIEKLGAFNCPASQTACADVHPLRNPVYDNVHAFDVRTLTMKTAARNLRTRNLDFSAEEHVFVTNFTSGHCLSP